MNAPEDVFTCVAKAVERTSLPILVIGGHAVNAYGYLRTTLDADFMVCIDDLPAWRENFEAAGYRWIGQTQNFARLDGPAEAGLLPLDVMLVGADTLQKMLAGSRQLSFGDAKLPTPEPLHLIALKLHAMKNPLRLEQGKDLPDILHLIRICNLDTTSPDFENILNRYGTQTTRDLLRKHLGGG